MTECSLRPHARPCVRCPWSRNTTPGEFLLARYEELRATVGSSGREAPLDAPMFACHKTPEGREQPCAGWLAAVGNCHLGIRFAIIQGRLDPRALIAKDDWPELFDDYDELIAAQARCV